MMPSSLMRRRLNMLSVALPILFIIIHSCLRALLLFRIRVCACACKCVYRCHLFEIVAHTKSSRWKKKLWQKKMMNQWTQKSLLNEFKTERFIEKYKNEKRQFVDEEKKVFSLYSMFLFCVRTIYFSQFSPLFSRSLCICFSHFQLNGTKHTGENVISEQRHSAHHKIQPDAFGFCVDANEQQKTQKLLRFNSGHKKKKNERKRKNWLMKISVTSNGKMAKEHYARTRRTRVY